MLGTGGGGGLLWDWKLKVVRAVVSVSAHEGQLQAFWP